MDAKVQGVIGHLNSGTSIPASKVYSDAGVPQISPSATNPKFTRNGYKTTFRIIANDGRVWTTSPMLPSFTIRIRTDYMVKIPLGC